MEQCSPEEYARKAGNPNSMGGNGQPSGRPTEPPQERDSNHPQGTNERAGHPGPSRDTGGTTPGY